MTGDVLFLLVFLVGWLALLVVLAGIDYLWGERIEAAYDRKPRVRR